MPVYLCEPDKEEVLQNNDIVLTSGRQGTAS